MAMTKKEKEAMKLLLERCQKAERKANVLDDLILFVYEEMKEDLKRLIEEEVEFAVSELQITT